MKRALRAPRAALLGASLALLCAPSSARAQALADAGAEAAAGSFEREGGWRGLAVEVEPVWGEGCAHRDGAELRVRLRNGGSAAVTGEASLALAAQRGAEAPERRAAFSLEPGARVELRLVVPRGAQEGALLRLRGADGRVRSQRPLELGATVPSLVVDASPQGRLAQQWGLNLAPQAVALGGSGALARLGAGLQFCAATRVGSTGAVALPFAREGWSGVALAVLPAATWLALEPAQRAALADWLLAGGALVLAPARPEELRQRELAALLGAGVRAVDAGAELAELARAPWRSGDAEEALAPQADTLREARSFVGGNLREEVFATLVPWQPLRAVGATAAYGAGEVHVLGFDPASPPAVGDPWAQQLVLRLAQRALRRPRPLSLAEPAHAPSVGPSLRAALEPREDRSERARWGLLAALVLGLWAPVSVAVLRRRGRVRLIPWLAPVGAVGALGLAALLGSPEAPARGAALGVWTAPAGMARGALRRGRLLWSEEPLALELRAEEAGLTLWLAPEAGAEAAPLRYRREGERERVEGLVLRPGRPRLVLEAGFASARGAVGLERGASGFVVHNGLPVALREVLVLDAGAARGWRIPTLAAGERREARGGVELTAAALQRLREARAGQSALASAGLGLDEEAAEWLDAALALEPELLRAAEGPLALGLLELESAGELRAREVLWVRVFGLGGVL